MSEENKQEQAIEQAPVEQPKEIDIETKFKQMREELEADYKSQIAGLNRAVSEKDKRLQELELSKLDEKARAERELELAREATEKERIELETIRRERSIEKSLLEVGLPVEFSGRVKGETDDAIKEDAKILKEFIDKQIEQGVEKWRNDKLGGKGPETGNTPAVGDLQQLYKKAKEANKKAEVIAIKRQAAAQGIELKL